MRERQSKESEKRDKEGKYVIFALHAEMAPPQETKNKTMEKNELRRIVREVSDLARRVGRHIWAMRQNGNVEIETKGRHDFVTHMDKLSESLLVAELTEIVPTAGFIAEERTRTGLGERLNWIVDPIDGTTNFIHKHPPFAISIALMESADPAAVEASGRIVAGVVYEMSRDELFAAYAGGGATLNGEPISVSKTELPDALVATGFPYNDFSRIDGYMRALRKTMEETAGVRRLGSAATDMAYVACGRYEAFFEYDLKPYDVAAGSILVSEAGGSVTDFSGGGNWLFGREMVATNGATSKSFRDTIISHIAQ